MYINYKLEGKFVNLRSVTVDDAEFILQIRNNPRISKYLPPLNVTIEQQRQWILKQRADDDSYYFLMENPEGIPIGTVGIYDIHDDHGEGGRSCCIGEPSAVIESNLLFTEFVFNTLKLSYIKIWVYEDNKNVIALNQSYGYEWTGKGHDEKGEPYREGRLIRERAFERNEKLKKKLSLIK